MRNVLAGALCVLLCACAETPSPQRIESPAARIEGEVILQLELTAIEASVFGLEPLQMNHAAKSGLYRLLPGVQFEDAAASLRAAYPDVGIEPNLVREIASNDPMWSRQWNMHVLQAETVWQVTKGAGVTVAVLDSGTSLNGEDTPIHMLQGWDFIDNDSNPHDTHGHGTHVAGTIAQATDNGIGVAGLAPEVNILPVRVLGTNGYGSSWGIAEGIRWATDNGAHVINMSLGSSSGSWYERDAVQYANDNGVVVVAATGNDGWNSISFPAAYDGVIAVGATDARDEVTSYSNYGQGLDIVAPGGSTWQDANGDGQPDGVLQETLGGWGSMSYQYYQGTSMATPHVAAAAALLIAAGASPEQVPDLLNENARDMGNPGWSPRSGWGHLDVVASLEAIGSAPPPNTPAPPPPPPMDTGILEDTGTAPPAPAPQPPPTGQFEFTNIQFIRQGNTMTTLATTSLPAQFEMLYWGHGIFGNSAGIQTDHELTLQVDPWETYFVELHAYAEDGTILCSQTFMVLPF